MWTKLENQFAAGKDNDKWELRYNDVVIGTIFKKPNGKFSVWFSSPMIVEKIVTVATQSFMFDSFDEAKAGFDDLLKTKALSWCRAVTAYCSNELK